jgi:hypothetical protein
MFAVPDGIHGEELCSVTHLRPVDGCPVYTEYFKAGDTVPADLCPVHRGTLKQAATQVVQGVLRRLGSTIAGFFGRR